MHSEHLVTSVDLSLRQLAALTTQVYPSA